MHTTAASVPARRVSATDLLLVGMAVIWGINFSVVKYGTTVLPPHAFNAARVLLAAATLVGVAVARGTPLPPRRDLLVLLGLGVIGNGVYQVFFAEGVAHARAGTASLVIAASPAAIAIAGRLAGVERVAARGWVGIGLALTGIALVTLGTGRTPTGDDSALGVALLVAAVASWATYTVFLKPYTARYDGLTVTAVALVGGALPLAAVSAPALVAARWGDVTPATWGAIAYAGLLSMAVAYLLWYEGVRRIGPTRTSMYANLQPIVALVVAWVALGEVPTAWQGAGAACVLSGLVLTRA
jgi:drug/metabolite transporter (DMT)-like permease